MAWKNTSRRQVGVLGAGSFGTVVANLVARHAEVLLYVRKPATATAMARTRQSAGYAWAPAITPTTDLGQVAARCAVLFVVVPAAGFRALMKQLSPRLTKEHVLIHGTKGLDVQWPQAAGEPLTRAGVKTMSEVIREESRVEQVGCMAGPNLASELSAGQLGATVVASPTPAVIAQGQALLQHAHFQVDSSPDLLGVELCGVLKNIMALAAGCLGGLGYGANAQGLLVSRGLAEMMLVGQAMGASLAPFWGLAGVGDLVATCTSGVSRNYQVGHDLAQGTPASLLLQQPVATAEGIHTVKAIRPLLDFYQLRAPIIEAMHGVLFEGLPVETAVQCLL